MNKINDEEMTKVSGGLRNVDKLEEFIRTSKEKGMSLGEVQRIALCLPACADYLYPFYDETGKMAGLEGADVLYEYTIEYYNSLPEPVKEAE